MKISIAYAEPIAQIWLRLEVPEPCTIEQAIARSGLLERLPHIDLSTQKVGVLGKVKPLDTPLSEGDRIEIYRPITADPETVQRRDDPDAA